MLIIGDIACPSEALNISLNLVFAQHPEVFERKLILANLEGLIDDERSSTDNTPVLYNHSSVLNTLSNNGVKAGGLANTQTLDIPEQFEHTCTLLDQKNIRYAGAGNTVNRAAEPVILLDGTQKVIVLNACWDFLLYHQRNPENGVYIHEINELGTLRQISDLSAAHEDAKIIVFLHWSFDLETLPFPMYREWAKALIDAGANCIIGCHSHCVQGGEAYKEGYIVYGLGNFFIPNATFVNGRLTYPDISKMELVFEINFETGKATNHWFQYEHSGGEHKLLKKASYTFEQDAILAKYSPFSGMTLSEYTEYYKKNRRKSKFIPVFSDFTDTAGNRRKNRLLRFRAKIARLLAKYKIISWQN